MNDKDDNGLSSIEADAVWRKRIFSKGSAIKWLEWVGWIIITVALWVFAQKSGCIMCIIFALFSAGVVFFKAWFSLKEFAEEVLPRSSRLQQMTWSFLILLISFIPLVVIYFISEIINTIIEHS